MTEMPGWLSPKYVLDGILYFLGLKDSQIDVF